MANDLNLIGRLRDEKTRESAFRELVRLHSPAMYAQIRRMVLDHDDADDVLQNALVKAWSNIGSFRGDAQLRTWLTRIAYNETLTFMSRKRTHLSIDSHNTTTDDEDEEKLTLAGRLMADEYFDGDEVEAHLQEAVADLPPKQRAVFNMKYYDDMSYDEMSATMGTSVGALKASYHHAVKKITAFFEALC